MYKSSHSKYLYSKPVVGSPVMLSWFILPNFSCFSNVKKKEASVNQGLPVKHLSMTLIPHLDFPSPGLAGSLIPKPQFANGARKET